MHTLWYLQVYACVQDNVVNQYVIHNDCVMSSQLLTETIWCSYIHVHIDLSCHIPPFRHKYGNNVRVR